METPAERERRASVPFFAGVAAALPFALTPAAASPQNVTINAPLQLDSHANSSFAAVNMDGAKMVQNLGIQPIAPFENRALPLLTLSQHGQPPEPVMAKLDGPARISVTLAFDAPPEILALLR